MGEGFDGIDVVFVYDVCLRLMQSSDPRIMPLSKTK
jgi:hypothetical protein